MPPHITEGKIIFRSWDNATGLSECESAFYSLDELFALCLRIHNPNLVDRVILRGLDDQGEARVLTLAFQSLKLGGEA